MKITIAQLNYHIGNFEKNSESIINAIGKAKAEGSDLIVFSELCVSGYPPMDLLERTDFIEKCGLAVKKIAAACEGIAAIIGSPATNSRNEGKKLFNRAFVVSEGKILFTADKALVPTYDIFDEYRYFEPGKSFGNFEFKGKRIALTICEDLWDEQQSDNNFEKSRRYLISPMDELAKHKPDLIINISALPFSYNKIESKTDVFRNKAKKHHIPIVMVNQTGANTELIFDGASMVIDPNGEIVERLPFFEESVKSFELDEIANISVKRQPLVYDSIPLINKALVMGIRDYFGKTSIRTAVLGLSGGIDSALVLALAAEALGPENVRAVLMPSRYSSNHSVTDSVKLAEKLGTPYDIISIEETFGAYKRILATTFAGKKADITEENLQARTRTVILMAISNKFGNMLLNTSNKSEAAVGYSTMYGDMAGGLSVLGDVYKTDVYKLARYVNREKEIIPTNIIAKAPSAELRPDQFDSDSLPDYEILDDILYQYIELQKPAKAISGKGINRETVDKVIRLINFNEYKRFQAPPVLRVSSKSLGGGRWMPLVAKY
jgi:NAD+ synthase (glutamine-hydrolysing)